MWTKRVLTVVVLFASSLPSATLLGFGDVKGLLSSGVDYVKKVLVNEKIDYVKNILVNDKIDYSDIRNEYSSVLKTVVETEWPCFKGWVYEVGPKESMTIWGGHLSHGDNSISFDVRDLTMSEPGFATAVVSFCFQNMTMEYNFQYVSSMVMSYTRQGKVKFKVGSATVDVTIKQPSSKKVIAEELKIGICKHQISMKAIQVKPAKDSEMEILEITYPSHTGLQISKSHMEKAFKNMKEPIYKELFHSLVVHVAQAVDGPALNCLDVEAAKQTYTVEMDKDCVTTRKVKLGGDA